MEDTGFHSATSGEEEEGGEAGKAQNLENLFFFFFFGNGGEASSGSAIRVHIICNLDVAVVGSVRL